MARSKKAATAVASDTVSFKKAELVEKIKGFLEENDACDGDWLTKVKVEFLGQKESNVCVEVKIPAYIDLTMAFDGNAPSKEEVAEYIRTSIDEGDWCGWDSTDEEDFEVTKVTVSK